MAKKYFLYFDKNDKSFGYLYFEIKKGKEIFSFEFDDEFLKDNHLNFFIDPDLYLIRGRQYPSKDVFGFMEDMFPDRRGRSLIKNKILNEENRTALNIDFLTLINDETRTGAIRIKENDLFIGKENSEIPQIKDLKDLENASFCYEDKKDDKSLKILLSPGSSLGGARPKINVKDRENNLWIAKFPSINDEYDVEKLEMIAFELAKKCEISVPETKLEKFAKHGSTLLSKRFDRNKDERIHYISVMTILGASDNSKEIYYYFDILDLIKKMAKNPVSEAKELYKRIVFSYLINNIDDHLRNHAFLLDRNSFCLSPMFDLNPSPMNSNHSLMINEEIGSNIKEITKYSGYFFLSKEEGEEIFNKIYSTILNSYDFFLKKYKCNNLEKKILLSALSINIKEIAFKN